MLKHTHSRIPLSGGRAALLAACALALAGPAVSCAGRAPAADSGAPVPASASTPQPIAGDVERTTFAPSLGVHLDQMMRRASGLYVQDLKIGTGAIALHGKSMVVRYTGWLANGKQFDSGEITVTIGAKGTIAAWEEGLLGMRVGGQRRLVVPPNLGYGARGAGDDIPPNAVLVFEMEITAAM